MEGLVVFSFAFSGLILWFYIMSLKAEKKAGVLLTEVAQELNNRKLHEAGNNLVVANTFKWWSLTAILVVELLGILILISQNT